MTYLKTLLFVAIATVVVAQPPADNVEFTKILKRKFGYTEHDCMLYEPKDTIYCGNYGRCQ